MSVRVIIGKNFGDEGKGLAADFFAVEAKKRGASAVCVRHNGGAQAGHTVDRPDGRFVFSQLSSASFRGVPTYWADSFMPDLFKLTSEVERFRDTGGVFPGISASADCRCTCIDDVLVNMLLETSRGADRHGSCGMGINEAAVRSQKYPLRLGEVIGYGAETLFRRLSELRRDHLPQRLAELGIAAEGEYGEMLRSADVLRNAAEAMCRGAEYIRIAPQEELRCFDELVFEGAQGLLLDEYNLEYAPHLTSSRTGLTEPARICRSLFGEAADVEAVYVTRSYVTRHGAGPLPYEGLLDAAELGIVDRTNVRNEWQGSLRFAPHGSADEFVSAVRRDIAEAEISVSPSLFITHLNETSGSIITNAGAVPVREFCAYEKVSGIFGRIYGSGSPFAEDVSLM